MKFIFAILLILLIGFGCYGLAKESRKAYVIHNGYKYSNTFKMYRYEWWIGKKPYMTIFDKRGNRIEWEYERQPGI